MRLTRQQLNRTNKILAYRANPVGFFRNILQIPEVSIWPKMVEIAESVRDNQLTAVRAGHSVSKTYTTARIVVWFKAVFLPSTVVTTAPSENQVKNQLWREIHTAIAGSRIELGGATKTTGWDMKPSKEVLEQLPPKARQAWEKNFAVGFATTPDQSADNATKMAGWHNENLLVCLDEAGGIHPTIWSTVLEGLVSDERCKVLAIGNPTDPESEFARVCYAHGKADCTETYRSDEGFNVITISAYDTPNYIEGQTIIPGVAGRDYVKRMEARLGKHSDKFRYRVLGLFPRYKEGTYYGQYVSNAIRDGRVGSYPHDPTKPVHTFTDFGSINTATIFAQVVGSSIRVIDDYWDNQGQGIPNWANALRSKDYTYGYHFAGPDIGAGGSNARSMQTGKTFVDTAAGLGFNVQAVIKHSFDDGIEAVRSIFKRLQIDRSAETFLRAIKVYGLKKNESASIGEDVVYHNQPAASWSNHMADALRHMAMAVLYHGITEQQLERTEFRQEKPYDPLGRRK